MSRQRQYEQRQRETGNATVSARLTAEQADVIKTAGGPTGVLRAIADAILAGCEIRIISGEGEVGTIQQYEGKRTIPAIRQRLGKERAGGDRWARAEIHLYEGPCGPVHMDAETGDFR